MTASKIAMVASMTDAEAAAIAYLQSAGGDAERALSFAVEDLLEAERQCAEARRAVSQGFVRAGTTARG